MRSSFNIVVAVSLLCSFVVSSAGAANAPQKLAPTVNASQEPSVQEPSVAALTHLLSHKIDDKMVQNFVKAQHLQKYAKGDSGGYDRNNDSTETFGLLFRGNIISRVIIHVVPVKGVASAYRGVLPFNVQASDSPAIIRKRFGKALYDKARYDKARYDIVGKYANKPGNGWLVYNKGAVKVTFAFERNKMYEIFLDAPKRF